MSVIDLFGVKPTQDANFNSIEQKVILEKNYL